MNIQSTDAARLVAQIVSSLEQGGEVIALTGAGASAESGISPFRAPGHLGMMWSGVGALGVGLAGTGYAWQMWPRVANFFYQRFFKSAVDRAKPNACHYWLAECGARIVTTNVDNLHERAGSRSEDVSAIHGTVYREMCTECGSEQLPCHGHQRPAVLFFHDHIRNNAVYDAGARLAFNTHVRPEQTTWVFVVGVSWAVPSLRMILSDLRAKTKNIVHVNLCCPPEPYFADGDVWVKESADTFFERLRYASHVNVW